MPPVPGDPLATADAGSKPEAESDILHRDPGCFLQEDA